ncbi:MAG: hypothetical protein LBR69_00800 [Endomicrobium sp.]|jgi:flavodoxin|nr:hypothetical protein [Endomicrobium sp.]
MKKFILAAFICAALPFAAFNYAQAQQNAGGGNVKKVLTVYYSYSGNTAKTAKQIQKYAGGDIFEIKIKHEYPSKYDNLLDQAKKEIADGFKPVLASKPGNTGNYDIVFVGSPVWWGTIAPAVSAFLSEYDLSGKTVVPFCTHGGGGISRTFDDIKKLCPDAKFLQGKGFNRSNASENEISDWIKSLNLN